MKEKIRLSGVPETMLQTVYARAKESRGRGAIHDAKAEEIIEKLDYDFSLADKDTAMRSGVIARTIVLDRMTKEWLASHPGAVVVNIACGLDTRCYRMSGYAHWYNLDLPETMAVREKLLPESGTISQITMSAMEDWGSEISEQNVPVLIVIEGLTMYLSERNIQRIFTVISSRFSNATVFVETMNPYWAEKIPISLDIPTLLRMSQLDLARTLTESIVKNGYFQDIATGRNAAFTTGRSSWGLLYLIFA